MTTINESQSFGGYVAIYCKGSNLWANKERETLSFGYIALLSINRQCFIRRFMVRGFNEPPDQLWNSIQTFVDEIPNTTNFRSGCLLSYSWLLCIVYVLYADKQSFGSELFYLWFSLRLVYNNCISFRRFISFGFMAECKLIQKCLDWSGN